MPPVVEIAHLDFAYRDALVLKHLDLVVERGRTLGLVGPNGGGKTTLVKLLLGLLVPTRGSVRVDGLPPTEAVRRGDVIGYLPQRPEIPGNFPISVRQLARLGLAGKTGMFRSPARDDLAFVDQLIEQVGVKDLADAPVGSLSGGQLQRVLIARALAPRPKVLVLDEPTTGIDPAGQQRFVDSIESLRRALGQLTVILVSHDLRSVAAMCDRIACLNVTLHYHDVPHRFPAELAGEMFACDAQALGLGVPHVHEATEPVR